MATPVDVRILLPKFKIDSFIGLFMKTILQLEKYRYNYSRKMGTDRLNEFKIKLPADSDNKPDWNFMRNYIKSLPYSSNI
jgi:type I restriction enzyme M protein